MLDTITIEDPNDPRIEPYRAVRERDLVGRQGRFVAEGEVTLHILLSGRSRFETESVLLSDSQAQRLSGLPVRPGVPVFVASRAVMETVTGFPIHRGVLAIGRRGPEPDLGALLPPLGRPALAVVLMGLTNHDNVGAVFRNAAAFGADLVLLDRRSCDPLYRKAIRVSAGTCLAVPFRRGGSGAALVDEIESAGFRLFGLSPRGARGLGDVTWPPRTALILGTEGPGLPPEILDRVSSVAIPMAPAVDSLNVATASGIVLQSVWSGRLSRSAPAIPDAGHGRPNVV